jgi:glutamine amidotransferase PdxT
MGKLGKMITNPPNAPRCVDCSGLLISSGEGSTVCECGTRIKLRRAVKAKLISEVPAFATASSEEQEGSIDALILITSRGVGLSKKPTSA